MRAAFHDDLDAIFTDLTSVCELVSVAVRDATTALLEARNDHAEQVIDKDAEIDDARERIEENFALFDFELTHDDMAAISSLDRGESGRTGPNPNTFPGR